ncbi:SpoIVB peptidase [Salsuginibacillus halophilus]|uniref:SpoIVB peptidase n=1 Tax=Salsuginibacillus halophilus TaxID=517424 RepID=A0A2P8HAF6_9BACI|nr:SpoIVB peptidase [Salsuginibacillus halophilus]PSL43206.1 SpoIVB peptidase [Salsuginibacillus halophilus]
MDKRRWMGVLFLLAVISFFSLEPVQEWVDLPDEALYTASDERSAQGGYTTELPLVQAMDDKLKYFSTAAEEDAVVISAGPIPVKTIETKEVPAIDVVPGGESIGIRAGEQGVFVVGYHDEDDTASAAKQAGVKPGDRLVKINDESIHGISSIQRLIDRSSGSNDVTLTLKRDEETIEKEVDLSSGGKLGIYVRESSAGVGTMTFFEPETGKYGALGHVVADAATKQPLNVHNGKIVRSVVEDIDKGSSGHPGEKRASMGMGKNELGSITKNNAFGIFGKLNDDHSLKDEETMPIAFPDQVSTGEAKMLTVVEGEEVEAFDIEVKKILTQDHPATKGMVIEVTDERLLEKTGGIIQGMSGSPIIQNDRLIGAVTHVFVNDAASGYAGHIEWMLKEADILTEEGLEEAG